MNPLMSFPRPHFILLSTVYESDYRVLSSKLLPSLVSRTIHFPGISPTSLRYFPSSFLDVVSFLSSIVQIIYIITICRHFMCVCVCGGEVKYLNLMAEKKKEQRHWRQYKRQEELAFSHIALPWRVTKLSSS